MPRKLIVSCLADTSPPVRRTYGRRAASPPPTRILFTPPPSSPSAGPSSLVAPSPPPRVLKRGILDSDPIESPPRSGHKRVRLGFVDTNGRDEDVSEARAPEAKAVSATPMASREKQATLASFFGPIKRRSAATTTSRAPSSPVTSTSPPTSSAPKDRRKLTQLHFMHDALRTCAECGMSYMRGGDEGTHTNHHARVTRGIAWPRQRRSGDAARRSSDGQVGTHAVSNGTARIIVVDSTRAGAVGAEIHDLVDTVLSAPPLSAPIRDACKLVLAVTAAPPPRPRGARSVPKKAGAKDDTRERVIAAVVAQPIKVAMRVVGTSDGNTNAAEVVRCDNVVCDPTPLPTPLGIHRLFVVPAYRGLGLARALLDAAAQHTVYGCSFDPTAGEVAFSQPTDSGHAVMRAWGRGGVRVFIDDERQL